MTRSSWSGARLIAENDELQGQACAAYESRSSTARRRAPRRLAEPVAAQRRPRMRRRSQSRRRPSRPRGIIELAQRLHDEHVAEGLAQRDKLIADAKPQARRSSSEAETARPRRARQARARARRPRDPHLRARVSSSATTAPQLRSYMEGKLRDLETMSTSSGVVAGLGHRPLGRPLTGRPPLRPSAAGAIIAVLALVVLAADQFTKYLALENLPPEEPVHVIGDFLIFYLVRNPGAAFSLGEGVTWIFTIALAVVAVVIVWLAATASAHGCGRSSSGCCSAACSATCTDRLFREPGFARRARRSTSSTRRG